MCGIPEFPSCDPDNDVREPCLGHRSGSVTIKD